MPGLYINTVHGGGRIACSWKLQHHFAYGALFIKNAAARDLRVIDPT
jgi:hypothetical protein